MGEDKRHIDDGRISDERDGVTCDALAVATPLSNKMKEDLRFLKAVLMTPTTVLADVSNVVCRCRVSASAMKSKPEEGAAVGV